jgi:hypothetical protein
VVELVVHLFQLETHFHRVDRVGRRHLVGEEQRAVVFDFHETFRDGELLLDASFVESDDARPERGQKRQMAGEHAELTAYAGRGDVVDLFVQREALRRDDFERDFPLGHQLCAFIFSPAALASSMLPRM